MAEEWSDGPLAVAVRPPETERAMDALRAEGVYDERRRLREREGAVEVPVTAAPTATTVGTVIEQSTPVYRAGGLPERLRERGWTDDEVADAPGSWAVVGDVILVEGAALDDAPRPDEVGAALLDLHGNAHTVLAREGIAGSHREPSVRVVAGDDDTKTVHVEAGTRYALDLETVMFSPGNERERIRMGEVVSEGERVLDMFAGVGYFALPMARAGARVTAVERRPETFRYLLENIPLNDVDDRLRPFRADCADVAPEIDAERVVMGHFDAVEYLDPALDALEPGGTIHLHDAVHESERSRPVERLTEAAGARGRDVTVLDRRAVKGYSEGITHMVVDATIG